MSSFEIKNEGIKHGCRGINYYERGIQDFKSALDAYKKVNESGNTEKELKKVITYLRALGVNSNAIPDETLTKSLNDGISEELKNGAKNTEAAAKSPKIETETESVRRKAMP